MFGGIFDFDMDGKIDACELALGLSILFADETTLEAVDEDTDFDFFDDEAEDDFSPERNISNLEWERGALEYRLSELQDNLFDLADEEPDDDTSAAYDRWERRKNRLEEQIYELEDKIAEMGDLISFGVKGIHAHAV